MDATTRSSATQIITASKAVGATLPRPVLEGHAETARLTAAARDMSPPPDALYAAVVAALDDGRDPAADPEVQRVVTATTIGNQAVATAVDNIAFGRFTEICREDADQIVGVWRKPSDKAVDVLTAAHDRIGDLPLEDTATIMAKGDDIAAVWADAQAAAKVIDTVAGGWYALADLTRLATNDPRYVLLRTVSCDYQTWQSQELERRKLTPWQIVLARLDLSLPTMSRYRDRVRVIEDGHAAAHEQAERNRSAARGGRRVEAA
jgi:hypothetical protein